MKQNLNTNLLSLSEIPLERMVYYTLNDSFMTAHLSHSRFAFKLSENGGRSLEAWKEAHGR